MEITAVLRFREEARLNETLDGTNDGTAALADKMTNPIETRIALASAIVEAIDDNSRDLLLRARKHV